MSRRVTPGGTPVPAWLRELADAARSMEIEPLFQPPASGGRASAVLVLFAAGRNGPDLLLIQRSGGLRLHAGEPGFPGGPSTPTTPGRPRWALRETAEEVGVDPAGVDVVTTIPELYIPPTRFRVVPMLAWWRRPCPVAPVDPGEVAAVRRVSVAELADPAARLMVRMPMSALSPAFRVRGMLIWRTTAMVIDRLLALAGWERPWDGAEIMDL